MSEEVDAVEEVEATIGGAFVDSLKRNNRQIKEDRAVAIAEDTELKYKRAVEDLEIKVKLLKRKQKGMLDLSGDSAISLKPAGEFESDVFVAVDQDLALEIRNAEIKLDLARERYQYLFGGNV